MANNYPSDRFDDVSDTHFRVGAHRQPPRRGRGWIAFAWAALATGLVVGLGVIGITLLSDSVRFTSPAQSSAAAESQAPTESVTPELDPDVSISILNGTATNGLANAVGDTLVSEGWCGAVGAESPVDGPCAGVVGEGSRSSAATTDILDTVVYYSAAEDESAALAIVESLGVGTTSLSEDYPQSPLVVVVGADYQPAG